MNSFLQKNEENMKFKSGHIVRFEYSLTIIDLRISRRNIYEKKNDCTYYGNRNRFRLVF
jgi:hypothetical protein